METTAYKASVELSTDGPTQVGEHLICSAGFTADFEPRRPVERSHVDAVMSIFAQCRRTAAVQPDDRLTIGWLKHDIERLAHCNYITRGAVLVAAFEMGITVVPIFQENYPAEEGFEPVSAYIGVNRRDIERLLREVYP